MGTKDAAKTPAPPDCGRPAWREGRRGLSGREPAAVRRRLLRGRPHRHDQGLGDRRSAARWPGLHRAGGPLLPHRLQRGITGRRSQSVERPRSLRTFLQRQDPRAACDPCQHRRPAVEHASVFAADGDHHPRHACLVRLGRRRRRRARRDRHALRPLHQPAAQRRRVSPLLSLEPQPGACGRTQHFPARGRNARA